MKQKQPNKLIRKCCSAYKSGTTVTALSNRFNPSIVMQIPLWR